MHTMVSPGARLVCLAICWAGFFSAPALAQQDVEAPPAAAGPGVQQVAQEPPQNSKEARPGNGSPATNQHELERYIEQLGHPNYHNREVAMRRLEKAGQAAIEPLEEAVLSGNLEVVDRASRILQTLAIMESPGDPPLAWETLERVKAVGPGSAATRADSSITMIKNERAVRAESRLNVAGLKVGLQSLTFAYREVNEVAIRFPAGWQVDEKALQWVPWMYDVTMIVIEEDALTDAVIDAIVQLPKLRDIQIRDAELSTRNLKKLADLKRIDTLELLFVDVGGAAGDLAAMSDLPLRKTLILSGTKFSEQDTAALQANFGSLEIEIIHSAGGFLGVMPMTATGSCVVSRVTYGLAADRAGIRPGDIITQFGEHPITNFRDLQVAVRKHAPGEKLDVEIIRSGQPITLQVELGRIE